jgi:hypothetical protein
MDDPDADVELALSEMRYALASSLAGGESLDRKVNAILAAGALVLGVASSLQVSLGPRRSDLYWAVLISAVFLYLFASGLALISGRPRSYHLPIAANWEEIDRQVLGRPRRDALLTLLSGYVDQTQHNERVNRRKANIQGWALALLAMSVVTILVLAMIP